MPIARGGTEINWMHNASEIIRRLCLGLLLACALLASALPAAASVRGGAPKTPRGHL